MSHPAWKSKPDDDCNGCSMMQALTKMNSKLKTAQTKGPQKSDAQDVEMIAASKKQEETNAPREPTYPEDDTGSPLDLNELGNATWGLLHTMAAYYPNQPSSQRQQSTRFFLESLGETFPCHVCGDDWKDVMQRMPPIVNSQKDFSQWLCQAHNDINKRLGKSEFPCEFVDRRWRAQMFEAEEEEES